MLTNFFKKKESKDQVKTDKIQEIQEFIASSSNINITTVERTEKTDNFYDVNKEKNFSNSNKLIIPKTKKTRKIKEKAEDFMKMKKQKTLEDCSFISNSSIIKDSNIKIDDNIEYQKPFLTEDATESIDLRKIKVVNAASRRVEVKYSISSAEIYLPKAFKKLSSLYKIISTVYSFNERRGLSLILVKYVDSIEKLFKYRVDNTILEQLNFICKDSIKFTPLKILDEGLMKETYKIDIKTGFDIDNALFNYYSELYSKWIQEKGIEGPVYRFHPDFLTVEFNIPQKSLISDNIKIKEVEPEIKNIAKAKADSIIERIKERERLRKEQFVKECTLKVDFESKINDIFSIINKPAIKLEELVFKIGGFDCKSNVLKALNDKYYLKSINGEEYVIKK